MMKREQKVAIFVGLAAFVMVVLVLAIGIGSGGGRGDRRGQPTPIPDRSNPKSVNDRIKVELGANDIAAVYDEMSPAMKELITLAQFQESGQTANQTLGNITKVEELDPPTVLTGTEFNNEWAQSKVRIIRQNDTRVYFVRFHIENGQWWFVGTIEEK
jgi:hypothetical protein